MNSKTLENKNNLRALGKLPSGLFILTSYIEQKPFGVLLSWIQQASFDPPLLSICIGKNREFLAPLLHEKRFCLNILGKNGKDLIKVFGKPTANSFLNCEHQTSEFGPILSKSLATAYCEIVEVQTPGDHAILFAEVKGGNLWDLQDEPLTHLRYDGSTY